MILRILGEGRFDVPDAAIPVVEHVYRKMIAAVAVGDEDAYASSLASLLTEVRVHGRALGADRLWECDAVLPGKDESLADVRILLEIAAHLELGLARSGA